MQISRVSPLVQLREIEKEGTTQSRHCISRRYRRILSQNCGRQPHIVSTNHSNLTAVGPNRSLASRQAIVWTYRPRVEATESRLPDFLPIIRDQSGEKRNEMRVDLARSDASTLQLEKKANVFIVVIGISILYNVCL